MANYTKTSLANAIENLSAEEKLQLFGRYEWVKFDWMDYDGHGIMEFSWTVSRCGWGYVMPTKNNGNTIKTWKTLKGAKRDFINFISYEASRILED
jgi:hypothetical protein